MPTKQFSLQFSLKDKINLQQIIPKPLYYSKQSHKSKNKVENFGYITS